MSIQSEADLLVSFGEVIEAYAYTTDEGIRIESICVAVDNCEFEITYHNNTAVNVIRIK